MKRHFSMALAMLFLLLFLVTALSMSIGAAGEVDEISWRKLTYSTEPTQEGGETLQGSVTKDCELAPYSKIHFDPAVTQLQVNGETVEGDSYQLSYAGHYTLTIINKQKPSEYLEYEIRSLPDINLVDEQVFTSYPTIICKGQTDIKHTYDTKEMPFESGTQIRALGKHLLTVYGVNGKNERVKVKNYTFYVKACDAVRVFDETSGKEALDVIVGEFDDLTVEATLDGTLPLNKGSNIVTAVGTHTLDATIKDKDGKPVVRAESLPDFEELSLRIMLGFATMDKSDALKTKVPLSFDFSRWDAKVMLDGKELTGPVRVGQHGEHVLTVMGADGKPVEGAFSVMFADSKEPQAMTEIAFTFQNPHLIYAILVAVPTVLLLGVACYFLIARRRVV